MAIWRFEDLIPNIAEETYVADSAVIIGDVKIGKKCYIGPGAVLRGDYGKVAIGAGTSIQENVVIHARPEEETVVGDMVTLGHGSILHTCSVEDYAVVGIMAVVSDYALMEEWSILAENSLLRKGQRLNKGEIGIGSPARVISNIEDRPDLKEEMNGFKMKYIEMAQRYLAEGSLERLG